MSARRRAAIPVALVVLSAVVLALAWHLMTRPFWYDEQWRAYHVALGPDQWSALPDANAPMAAGWLAVEQIFGAVFGLHEWALRLPSAIALLGVGPATYLLGRWWLSRPAAAVAGLLVLVNGDLLVYGLLLKPYLIETALCPVLIHSWLCARRSRALERATWPAYLGMGGICLISLPGVFVLGPLLLVDAVHSLGLRRRGWKAVAHRLCWPVVAGSIALVQLATVVRRQSFLIHDTFWQHEWIHGAGQALRQVGSYASNFVTLGLSEPDGTPTSPFHGSPLLARPATSVLAVVGLLVGVLLVTGAFGSSRHPDSAAFTVVIATLGAVALITVAAVLDIWPAGAVRVNLFLLPLLSVIAVTGAVELAKVPRVRMLVPVAWCLAAALTAVGVHWTFVVRSSAGDPILLGDVRTELGLQRSVALPGDLAVLLVGRPEVDQWTKGNRFYTADYDWGSPGYGVPATSTFDGDGWQPGAVTRWLAGRRPAHLFLSTYNRVTDTDARGVVGELRHDGWCVVEDRTSRLTGTWSELRSC